MVERLGHDKTVNRMGEERTPSAVEPLVDPKASPKEKSSRSQPSMTPKSPLVSATMRVATWVE